MIMDHPTVTLPSGAIVLAKPDGTPLTYGNKAQALKKADTLGLSVDAILPTDDGKRFYVVTGYVPVITGEIVCVNKLEGQIDRLMAQLAPASADPIADDEPVTMIPATPRSPGYAIPQPHFDEAQPVSTAIAHMFSRLYKYLAVDRPYRRGDKSGRRSFLFGASPSARTTMNPRNRHNHEHSTDARHTITI